MKNAIIVHGRTAAPDMHWFKEEAKILESKGYKVTIPRLSDDVRPKMEDWMKVLEKEKLGEDTLLIGHSLGTVAILRLLERTKVKVQKVILLAAYSHDLRENYEAHEFVKDDFDWDKIKTSASEFIIINEKNDPNVRFELGKEVAEKLNAELVISRTENHMHHFDLDIINSRL